MSAENNRRQFLKTGSLTAAGILATGVGASAAESLEGPPSTPPTDSAPSHPAHVQAEYDGFSRYKPSRGNDPESPYYLGKQVPGFRTLDEGPAPFDAPQIPKLPYVMKNGVKEFHLVPQPVQREFLPGYWMNVWGFNGSMPGPTIEINQGDRIRIIVTNELPEIVTVHLHGFEMPVQYDGADTMTQNPIPPGKQFVYEFDVHEEGTYFYHTHVAMQEAFGMVGWVIVHPRKTYDPPVDRDFGLLFQNFFIAPNQTVADSMKMDWNWHTINGRSGPYFPPLVCKHGERVRVRLLNFSPMQHHPIHMHGHTFWLTGHEGARAPKSAWIPRNTELIAVAQASDFEFIANNPGDWMFHCHMVHHMMNHMVEQVGPRIRKGASVDRYLANLDSVPQAVVSKTALGEEPPGYPQKMQGMHMSMESMKTIWAAREMKGMRAPVPMSMAGLMTAMRVLPADLYHRVMETDEDIPKGEIFDEIVRRFGDPETYQPSPQSETHGSHE
ncbi:Multicopper oxidase mco [Symmachiella dynata]|uniref:Multicopper oxidase mco n=1 Tax=Symmachiella dynata TaxID=2527995 RepID=A0A517ZPT7_9PLAN|nr:copper oxidase [Symmachiella dynata]QDU44505.1 Multicopper oxidase mco [Symmachiella dynata]